MLGNLCKKYADFVLPKLHHVKLLNHYVVYKNGLFSLILQNHTFTDMICFSLEFLFFFQLVT